MFWTLWFICIWVIQKYFIPFGSLNIDSLLIYSTCLSSWLTEDINETKFYFHIVFPLKCFLSLFRWEGGDKLQSGGKHLQFSSVQSLSHVWLFATPWTTACQASLSSITNFLLKFMSIESVMPSNNLILCCPLLLLPSIFSASGSFPMSQFFSSGGQSISFSFSISPSNEYSGLISFRIDWFDLLVVQGTLKSLLQHHSPYI